MSSFARWRLAILLLAALAAASCGTSGPEAQQAEPAVTTEDIEPDPTAEPAPTDEPAPADEPVPTEEPAEPDPDTSDPDTSDTDTSDPDTSDTDTSDTDTSDPDTSDTDTSDTDSAEDAGDPAAVDSDQASQPEPTQSDATSDPLSRPAAPNGRTAPVVATTPEGLAEQIAAAETGLLDPTSTAEERADWGHLHQVAIRKIGYEPEWDIRFFEALPSEFRARTLLHVSARRAISNLHSGFDAADFIPAWEIIEPESADSLVAHYQEAEAATGIEWEFLAGINLIETGMGRIRGVSSAGAQGPMQFLPTTWEEAGIGAGDINDPRDAINGAARYLVRRGGPTDMQGALWGYNNSDDYVTAVRAYAELLRQDPTAYETIYNWEIYFFTEEGDVWLPTGLFVGETADLTDYLAANPWSVPDLNLRVPES